MSCPCVGLSCYSGTGISWSSRSWLKADLGSSELRSHAVSGGAEPAAGDVGPDPAAESVSADLMAARSSLVRFRSTASTHPRSWSGRRPPTMAALTPGQLSVHATATAETVVLWDSATSPIASRRERDFGPSWVPGTADGGYASHLRETS